MQIDRATVIKLASFAGVATVAGAFHYFGVGEHAIPLLGTALHLLGEGAHAWVGHLGVHLIDNISGHGSAADRARGAQNRDLHRLMGETIARILEREAARAPGGKFGTKYLVRAAAAFRTNWMAVELTGPETVLSEPAMPAYFTGDSELIKATPVLEPAEWVALVERVAGRATFREYDEALHYAATELGQHFAFELWEAAKDAWAKDDLAWPALNLRLLSLILGHASNAARNGEATAAQLTALQREFQTLSDKISAAIPRDESPQRQEMLDAIRGYQNDLHSKLDRIGEQISGLDEHLREVLIALEKPRPVIEPPRQPADPARYLDQLRKDTEFIDIRGLQVSGQKARRFRIDELYTPLTTVLADHPTEKGARLEPNIERRPTPLVEALRKPRVVLVGDPGAGKSTFLRRIAFAACETLTGRNTEAVKELLGEEQAPFPILIPASTLSTFMDEKGLADECLALYLDSKSRANRWDLPPEFFSSKLSEGCLLLVDGLDEAPDRAHRKRLTWLLEKAAGVYEGSRIVVTSRPSAYGGETSIEGYDTVSIAPLDAEAVATFVKNWCTALYPADPSGAEKHREELDQAIHSRPEIEELGRNPVMLTALAVLHWNEKRLPDQRADLYDSILTWLARPRDAARARTRRALPGSPATSRLHDACPSQRYAGGDRSASRRAGTGRPVPHCPEKRTDGCRRAVPAG